MKKQIYDQLNALFRANKEQLKELGGRFNFRLSCGAGWIFPKSKQAELKALISGEVVMIERQTEPNNIYIEPLKEYAAIQPDSDYCLKNYVGAVKIEDKFLLIEKPTIEKQFWFSDEGCGFEYYKELTKDARKTELYFLGENMKEFDCLINTINSNKPLYIDSESCSNRILLHTYSNGYRDYQQATAEQRAEILEALEYGKTEFAKRLTTYLKKYGISKLRIGTYWADR